MRVELGRSRLSLDEVNSLAQGFAVELDTHVEEPVDVFVHDRLVARGRVLIVNDTFCVRLTQIIADVPEQGQR